MVMFEGWSNYDTYHALTLIRNDRRWNLQLVQYVQEAWRATYDNLKDKHVRNKDMEPLAALTLAVLLRSYFQNVNELAQYVVFSEVNWKEIAADRIANRAEVLDDNEEVCVVCEMWIGDCQCCGECGERPEYCSCEKHPEVN